MTNRKSLMEMQPDELLKDDENTGPFELSWNDSKDNKTPEFLEQSIQAEGMN